MYGVESVCGWTVNMSGEYMFAESKWGGECLES